MAGAQRQPAAHPVLGVDVGALLHQALGRNRLVFPRRKVQRGATLHFSRAQKPRLPADVGEGVRAGWRVT